MSARFGFVGCVFVAVCGIKLGERLAHVACQADGLGWERECSAVGVLGCGDDADSGTVDRREAGCSDPSEDGFGDVLG